MALGDPIRRAAARAGVGATTRGQIRAHNRARLRALVAAAAAGLAACGGGGSGGGAPPPAPPPEPPASLTIELGAPAPFASGLIGVQSLTARVTATGAAAAAGVAAVEFQADGQPLGDADTEAPYEARIDTAAYTAGQHVLRARARGRDCRLSDWATATVSFGGAGVPPTVVPAGFRRESGWVAGLRNATAFAPAPDGRLFVAEQDGAVRVVRNGVLLAKPFHAFDVDSRGERGVIGIALHPDFVRNGFVYVYHTTREGGTHNRISRLVASGDVSTGAATVLVELPVLSSATNHNGGGMLFGADGMLYVGVGENAQGALAQDLSTPLGKLLRLRDDGSVPPDNPFAASRPGLAGAIWSYGLRNPYTLAVQPGSGRIHVNDVGAGRWEEIDLAAAGANFGWPGSEGPDGVSAGVTAPIFAYGHTATDPPGSGPGGFFTGIAIAGGAFYPAGGSFPAAYHGSYFFGDFTGGFVARLDPADPAGACAFARIDGTIVDVRVGADGALYVLQRDRITRIAPA